MRFIKSKLDDITVGKYKYSGIDIKALSGEDHNGLPVSSVFIIDQAGVIQFSYTNPDYKVGLQPRDLLDAAKTVVLLNQENAITQKK